MFAKIQRSKVVKSTAIFMRLNSFLSFAVLLPFFFGCANFSSNRVACENADLMFPLPYSFLGNVFQISPCTSIEPLRIEIGVELDRLRGGVNGAIRDGQLYSDFSKFADKMGCKFDVQERLLKLLVEKKNAVFGADFEKSNRQVVRAVI